MITLPKTIEEAKAASGAIRAGGTDLTELRHRGIASGLVVDLRDVAGLDGIDALPDGSLRVGASVPLQAVADDARVRAGWRGVAEAAGALATPQIRARATLAGSLLQEVRCWYFRSPDFGCLKKGGATCFARTGDAVFHAVFDLGPCIAPHPSTMACALWAYDARIEVHATPSEGEFAGQLRDVPALLGDGRDPRRTHAVAPGEVVTAVVLPPPVPGEKAAYLRTIARARAEWPLVEATVRVRLEEGRIALLVLALGGVANRPLRLDDAARACVGLQPDDPRLDEVLAGAAARPDATLKGAAYKVKLVPATLRDALDRALEAT